MKRLLNQTVLWALLLGAAGSGQAFSLLGPYLSWQIRDIGYALPGDIGGPMDKTAYYRWNVRDIYYAFDQSFLLYFGARGAQAVDEAMAVLNALPPASQIDLNNYPQTDMLRENYQATALGMYDVKSTALHLMMEELGLADPIRFTWTLRLKQPRSSGGVTWTNYAVIKLNYDPETQTPSSFVNGFLWTYQIYDPVGPPPFLDFAEALEFSTDTVPYANGNPTPVASWRSGLAGGPGLYWIGLTRDDVGGLKYLLRTNTVKVESVLPGVEVAITNRGAQLLLTNYDLGTFIFRTTHTTNDTATVQGFYPDAVIASTNTVLEPHTNILSYFTNAPLTSCTPYPICMQVTNTNATASVSFAYDYTMANAVTNVIVTQRTNLVNGTNVITASSNATVYFIASNLFGYDFVVNQTNFIADLESVTNFSTGDTFIIDTRAPVAISTTNLALFNELARTNSPTQLLTFFPDLLILDSAYTITNAAVTNYYSYLTNPPYAPAGTIMPAFVPQVTNVLVTNYTHHFGNVITNTLFTNSPVSVQKIEVYRPPWSPASSTNVATNAHYTTYYSNVVNGSMYIIPTNLVGYQIIASLLTNYFTITNAMIPSFFGTNQFGTNQPGTNIVTTNALVYTNKSLLLFGTNYTFSAYPMQRLFGGTSAVPIVTFSTNIISLVYPIQFQSSTNNAALRLGVDKLTFHRANYDSLIGSFFVPITNQLTSMVLTNDGSNSVVIPQVCRRIIGQPDIVFLAEDLQFMADGNPWFTRRTDPSGWINDDALNGQTTTGGPGVIRPPVQIFFNNMFPIYMNQTPSFLNEQTATSAYVWGSFDGTTNAPIVYPSWLSLQDLEAHIFNPPPLP